MTSPASAELRPCPSCGQQSRPGNAKGKGEFTYLVCNACDLGFFVPLLFPGKAFYEGEGYDAYSGFHQDLVPLSPWHQIFFRHWGPSSGTLLDIGCGNGAFLSAAQRLGFEVHGLDFDRKSVQFARERRLLERVHALSIEEFTGVAAKTGLKFHLITAFEVLEHQVDPARFLRHVIGLLRPGGIFAGTVPNRERLLWGEFEDSDFPPHHFLRWNSRSLTVALRQAGFASISTESANIDNWSGALTNAFSLCMFGAPKKKIALPNSPREGQSSSADFLPKRALHFVRDIALLPVRIGAAIAGRGENLFFKANLGN